jgi:hypothetical protein
MPLIGAPSRYESGISSNIRHATIAINVNAAVLIMPITVKLY